MREVYVGARSELEDGTRKIVTVGGREIAVLAHQGAVHAVSNHCPHSGGPVGEGTILPRVLAVIGASGESLGEVFSETESHLVCPWHGWEYSLDTGACAGDNSVVLPKYQVVERDGDVYVVA